jgi:hypothetical protein
LASSWLSYFWNCALTSAKAPSLLF